MQELTYISLGISKKYSSTVYLQAWVSVNLEVNILYLY